MTGFGVWDPKSMSFAAFSEFTSNWYFQIGHEPTNTIQYPTFHFWEEIVKTFLN